MNIYKPKDFAKMLGVTVRTLQKWDVAGKLKAFRTPTNRRFYTQEQLDVYMGNSTRVQNQKKVILYARVSTAKQRDDLKNQVSFLREFVNARGVIVDRVMTDIGSGLNLKRKQWNELIKMAEEEIACNVHYKPLPMMTAYKNLGFDIKDYPNAYERFANEITMPLHTRLTDEEVDYIIEKYTAIVKQYL